MQVGVEQKRDSTVECLQCISIRQFHKHAQWLKVKSSGGPLDNQTWQTEWKTVPLAKAQMCGHEYENQGLEAFVAVNGKFDCPVARQNFSLKVEIIYAKPA